MIEIREKIEALREQFKTETGENYINSQGEPDIEYMAWIEERLVKESDSLSCVSESACKHEAISYGAIIICNKCKKPL